VALVLCCFLAPLSCSGTLPWLRGDLTNHPPALIGQWVDLAKSSPSDTSVWVLEPNGYDGGIRITRDSLGDGAPHTVTRKYGYWYVRGAAASQEFCVNQRPGRNAPSCTRFTMETDSSVVPPRRIIRLSAYAGEHHTSERVLVDRR
jgi:hypothetical protein